MYVDMLSNISLDLPTRLRVATAAGAPCSPQLIRQMKEKLNVESVGVIFKNIFIYIYEILYNIILIHFKTYVRI